MESLKISRYLLILFVVSTGGLLIELLLLGHYEDSWQWTPIILLGLALTIGSIRFFGGGPVIYSLFNLVSLLLIASGFLGVYLHFEGNKTFELEMYPDLKGWELFWKTMTGATPALSPATMTLLGFIGYIYMNTKKLIPQKQS
jgi:hypothetical protein